MQHWNSFTGGYSGAILTIIFIAILFIVFPFQYHNSLMADSPGDSAFVRLRWTAPGDDGDIGRASEYDIRYSLDSLTEENWSSAVQVDGEPAPHTAGTNEAFIVSGLEPNTEYFFGIKTADDAGNWSGISNVVRVTAGTAYECGEVNGDGSVNVSDVVTIVNYVFQGGGIPVPLKAADTNCDGGVNISDAAYLANYIFAGGTPPCDVNQDGSPDC